MTIKYIARSARNLRSTNDSIKIQYKDDRDQTYVRNREDDRDHNIMQNKNISIHRFKKPACPATIFL